MKEILRFAQDDSFAVGSLAEPVPSEREGWGVRGMTEKAKAR
jgi:hypothetical protein